MYNEFTNEKFSKAGYLVIAQDDDEGDKESGFIVVRQPDGQYAIGRYGHCSCYGTWTSLCGGGIAYPAEHAPIFDWVGTLDELRDLARRNADPSMPEREMDKGDCDYNHLQAVYRQILAYTP